MKAEMSVFSEAFQRLYCDPTVFEGFSVLHPISFNRVLPFQAEDPVMDDPRLLSAEAAHLAKPGPATRLAVAEAFGHCGLLPAEEVASLKLVLDYFDGEFYTEFFELMGEVYANAGMFINALRWHREVIANVESQPPGGVSDGMDVYASVGYCLYSLGLFPEAIAWSKSCLGPRQIADTVCRALIDYEAQLQGGCVRAIERAAGRTRYTANALDPAQASQLTPRLKLAMNTFAPFQETHLAWISSESPMPEIQPEGYPFQAERDGGTLTRNRMNFIFAACGHADELIGRGFIAEAKRLLLEVALAEPQADFIRERLKRMA
jgi:hypothetical protein